VGCIGHDGTINGIHLEFASPASGQFNDQLKAEFNQRFNSFSLRGPLAIFL